ncbi:hypothetical protein IKZ77_02685 [Candidatus Saccharibacteria bacterium]|nr:hypothetical protein [Candidatus Saccharibacteria bacterium]
MLTKEFEEYTITYGVGNQETKTWVATSESLAEDVDLTHWTLSYPNTLTIPISDWNTSVTIGTSNLYESRPRRLRCEYCGCISSKEFGTCEHCGAPLTIEVV